MKISIPGLRRVSIGATGHRISAFIPAVVIGAYMIGGEWGLMLAAAFVPAFIAAGLRAARNDPTRPADGITGLPNRACLLSKLSAGIAAEATGGRRTACLALGLDDFDTQVRLLGSDASERVLKLCADRIRSVLRDTDIASRTGGATFAIALAPVRLDLEAMIQLSARLQNAVAEPLSLNGTRVCITASVGFCLPSRVRHHDAEGFLQAAEDALAEARFHGPGTIRSFNGQNRPVPAARSATEDAVAEGLAGGEFHAAFQPQICTDTGTISGIEVLARWQPKDGGTILPSEFLPAILGGGLSGRLGEVMLYQALNALRNWDRAGISVPSVGVNFSRDELAEPGLPDRLLWELERFDLTPERLTVEILETVVADTSDDIVVRNVLALSQMGCRIDLDDFGTGHTSLATIRRFKIDRLKIDRSFVTRIDIDREQQKMMAAILTMAERLDLETVAEGVETVAEHAMLAQLGCRHVQGFVLARPMPVDQVTDWLMQHGRKVAQPQFPGRHAS